MQTEPEQDYIFARVNGAILCPFLLIPSKDLGVSLPKVIWEVLKGVSVDGVGANFPFLFLRFPSFSPLYRSWHLQLLRKSGLMLWSPSAPTPFKTSWVILGVFRVPPLSEFSGFERNGNWIIQMFEGFSSLLASKHQGRYGGPKPTNPIPEKYYSTGEVDVLKKGGAPAVVDLLVLPPLNIAPIIDRS